MRGRFVAVLLLLALLVLTGAVLRIVPGTDPAPDDLPPGAPGTADPADAGDSRGSPHAVRAASGAADTAGATSDVSRAAVDAELPVRIVTVRVVGPDGKPVTGATVQSLIPSRRQLEPTTKRTGADGVATFDDLEASGAEAFLAFAGTELAAVVSRPESGGGDVVARLTPAIRVTGRVERVDGSPLEGARCVLFVEDAMPLPDGVSLGSTDERGDVAFPPFPRPAGRLRVSANVVRYGVEPVDVVADVSEAGTFVIRPREPRVVAGRCVDGRGRPVADVEVTGGPHQSRTGPDGRFRWVGADPSLESLLLDASDFAPVSKAVPRSAEDFDAGDVTLTAGVTIGGTVVDAAGRALPHVMVWAVASDAARWPEHWQRRTFASASGTFEIRGLPEGEDLRVSAFAPTLGDGEPSAAVPATGGDGGVRVILGGRLAVLRLVAEAGGHPVSVDWCTFSVFDEARTRTRRSADVSLGDARFDVAVVRFAAPGRHVLRCRAHADADDGSTAFYVADDFAVVVADGTTTDADVRLRPQTRTPATGR